MDSQAALKKMKEGNHRFASGLRSIAAIATEEKRLELAESGQKPFAIVLSCADSRVPSEIVFDCGIGDLFVLRVAGNIVAPSLIGSIEFAAQNFGTSLCVVVGHSQCGAVSATVDCVKSGTRPESDHVQDIVLAITPAVQKSMQTNVDANRDALVADATERNVRNSMESLIRRSKVIADLIKAGSFEVVGATYDLHTGRAKFLEKGVEL